MGAEEEGIPVGTDVVTVTIVGAEVGGVLLTGDVGIVGSSSGAVNSPEVLRTLLRSFYRKQIQPHSKVRQELILIPHIMQIILFRNTKNIL